MEEGDSGFHKRSEAEILEIELCPISSGCTADYTRKINN